MAKAAATTAGAAAAARTHVQKDRHDNAPPSASPQKPSIAPSPLATSSSPPKPSNTSSSKPTTNRPATTPKETSLLHRTALHRSTNPTPSQPVLVTPAPQNNTMARKPHRAPRSAPPKLPSPSDFTFQDILTSIGPEADAAIDAIAEICGRSKLSLADEHGSHMPPQGEVEVVPQARLAALVETEPRSGAQTRSMSRRLREGAGVGEASVATSRVAPLARGSGGSNVGRETRTSNPATLLPQMLAWLRGEGEGRGREQDAGALGMLHRLLDERAEMRT